MHLDAIEKQSGVLQKMKVPEDFRMAGWVYVLSNEFMPGIYKVGMTTTSPATRAKELSSATGVPVPFKIEAAFHCEDPAASEAAIHQALADCRVNDSREFFKEDIDEIHSECHLHCEASTEHNVEDLANDNHIISFEKLHQLNVSDLFSEIGLCVFGDKLAIAERLIRIGAKTFFQSFESENLSLVFHDNKAYAIEGSDSQFQRFMYEEQQNYEAEKLAAGIYGPQLPVDF